MLWTTAPVSQEIFFEVAYYLRRSVESLEINVGQIQISTSCSISVAIADSFDHGEAIQSLYLKADQAVYRAKSLGRNRVERFVPLCLSKS